MSMAKKVKLISIVAVICIAITLLAVSCNKINGIEINKNHKEINVVGVEIKTKSVNDERNMTIDIDFKIKKRVEKLNVSLFILKLNGDDVEVEIYNSQGIKYQESSEISNQGEEISIAIKPIMFELNSAGGYSVELSYNDTKLLWYSR